MIIMAICVLIRPALFEYFNPIRLGAPRAQAFVLPLKFLRYVSYIKPLLFFWSTAASGGALRSAVRPLSFLPLLRPLRF